MLAIDKDIHSLSDFQLNASEILEQMRGSGNPLVLTVDGNAEMVVLDASAYKSVLNRVDKLEALDGIKRGLEDVAAGRVSPLRAFEEEFRSKHGLSNRPR